MKSPYMKSLFSLAAIFLAVNLSYAQVDKTMNPLELMVKAYEHLSNEDTASYLEHMMAIHPNDTAYTTAMDLAIVILEAQGKHEECLKISKKCLAMSDENESSFYINLGNSYLNLERYDEALATYEEGIKKYPYNHILQYNIGIAYYNLKRIDEYVEALKKTVSIYPFYPDAHRELGTIAESEGRLTQALMSYIMAILTDPTSAESNALLAYANEMVTDKLEVEPEGYDFPADGDDYSEIDEIISNYVALQKAYKVKSKAKIPLVKQLHVVMESLEYDPMDEGYWMKTYVRFYKKLWDEDLFEEFSYYLLKASRNTRHQKLALRKSKDIAKFSQWAGTEIKDYFDQLPIEVDSKSVTMERRYGGDGTKALSSLGEVVDGKAQGCWYHIHSSGAIKGRGCFDKFGEAKGKWKWYNEKGQLTEEYDITGGELNGKYLVYFDWGGIYKDIQFKDDRRNGVYKEYHVNGGVYTEQEYVNGKLDGIMKYYHENGQLSYYFKRKNELLDGTFKQYFPNGQLQYITSYTEGEIDSASVSYWWDGTVKAKFTYAEGKLNGPYEEFFQNGKTERKGSYTKGSQSGENVDYFLNGNLFQKNTYDLDAKKNGISVEYDKDGIKYIEYDYKKGNIIAYRVFDKDGKITKQGKKKRGEFLYEGAYPDGTRKAKGLYDSKGGQEGKWQFYDHNGNLDTEAEYKESRIQGTWKEYFSNGELSAKADYDDGTWDGLSISYYRNGQLVGELTGEAGERERGYVRHSPFGDTTQSLFYVQGNLYGPQYYYSNVGKLDRILTYQRGELITEIYCDTNGVIMDTIDYRGATKVELKNHDGKVVYSAQYASGLNNGEAIWYYGNGQISAKGQYVNGKRDGKFENYHPNGKLSYTYNYQNGERHGKSVRYDESGKISETFDHAYDNLEGVNKSYYENGKLSSEFNYSMGFKHGEARLYDPNGVLGHIRYYHYGKIIGYSYLGKDGKPVPMIPITNETAEVKSYFQNGNVARTYNLKSGQFDGVYEEFYQSGKLAENSKNKDGWNYDEYLTYYENGNLKRKSIYKFDELHGPTTYYYENGKVKSERYYVHGTQHGTWKFYDKNGKLTHEVYYYDGDLITEKKF